MPEQGQGGVISEKEWRNDGVGAKYRDSKFAACPFFRGEDTQKIYCEGVEKGTAIHLAFASKSEKKRYGERHCNRNFKSCRVFQMNDSLYDEFGYKQ